MIVNAPAIIGNENFTIIEEIWATLADSFVKDNKLSAYKGSGEARLWLGGVDKIPYLDNFFGSQPNCFMLKSDLTEYLKSSFAEYGESPILSYRDPIKDNLNKYYNEIIEHDLDRFFFSVVNVPSVTNRPIIQNSAQSSLDDHLREPSQPIADEKNKYCRFYIRYADDTMSMFVWYLIRGIGIPKVTKIKIAILRDSSNKIFHYFKLIYIPVDRSKIKPKHNIKISNTKDEKEIIKNKAAWYRKKLLQKYDYRCPLSGESDPRFLIASHTRRKKDCDDLERWDVNNGLPLDRNHDGYFDRYHISFDENLYLLISEFFPADTRDRDLKKWENRSLIEELKPDGRFMEYMEWHRNRFIQMELNRRRKGGVIDEDDEEDDEEDIVYVNKNQFELPFT